MPPPLSLLLPGLDGTGDLFESFVAATPSGLSVRIIRLPQERPLTYAELTEWVVEALPPEPVVLIAESFSGPLALSVASKCPRVQAIVLCASFVERPLPKVFAHFAGCVSRQVPPVGVLSLVLAGGDRELAVAVRAALRNVRADIVASRIAALLNVDVTAELEQYSRPLLYLRGTGDRIIGARSLARLRALKPTVRVVEIDGPHLLLQARPVEAWSHIKPFLEQVAGHDAS